MRRGLGWLTAEMEKLGVRLVKGDLAEASSYADALKGADGVFLNVNCEPGPEEELARALD